MQSGDPPELRRIYQLIYFADGITPATDADVGMPAGSLKLCINGAALVSATGNFVGNGAGEYYYEFTNAEIPPFGFLMLVFTRPGYNTTWFPVGYVGDVWLKGATDPAKLRAPMVVYDLSEPPQLVLVAANPAAGELKTAFNNVGFGNAAGSLVFVGLGLHYYQGVAGDAVGPGNLLVKLVKAGFQQQDIEVGITDSSGFIPIPPPPAGTSLSGLSFVPQGFAVINGSTIIGGLDRLLDPLTGNYVRTPNGEWAETQDSRTIMLIAMSEELGESPFDPDHGTGIEAQRRAGIPLTPDYLEAETSRVGADLAGEGILSGLVVETRDAAGRPLRDETGRQVVKTRWHDLASGSPIDLTITPR